MQDRAAAHTKHAKVSPPSGSGRSASAASDAGRGSAAAPSSDSDAAGVRYAPKSLEAREPTRGTNSGASAWRAVGPEQT